MKISRKHIENFLILVLFNINSSLHSIIPECNSSNLCDKNSSGFMGQINQGITALNTANQTLCSITTNLSNMLNSLSCSSGTTKQKDNCKNLKLCANESGKTAIDTFNNILTCIGTPCPCFTDLSLNVCSS